MGEHHDFILCRQFAARSPILQHAFCRACSFWHHIYAELLPQKCHAGYRDMCGVRQRTTSTLVPMNHVGMRGGKPLPWEPATAMPGTRPCAWQARGELHKRDGLIARVRIE